MVPGVPFGNLWGSSSGGCVPGGHSGFIGSGGSGVGPLFGAGKTMRGAFASRGCASGGSNGGLAEGTGAEENSS